MRRRFPLIVSGLVIVLVLLLYANYRRELEVRQRFIQSSQEAAIDSRLTSYQGMYVMDEIGKIIYVNPTACEILSYREEELIGAQAHTLFHAHDEVHPPASGFCPIRLPALSGEIWNRRKSGEIYPEQLRIAAVRQANGTVTGYVATFNDITEKLRQEQVLCKLAYNDPLTELHNRAATDTTTSRRRWQSGRRIVLSWRSICTGHCSTRSFCSTINRRST